MAMDSLDDFLDGVLTQDVRKRFVVHAQLVSYLGDPQSSLKSDDLDRFVEGLAGWVSCSNYKVSVERMKLCVCLCTCVFVFMCVSDTVGDSTNSNSQSHHHHDHKDVTVYVIHSDHCHHHH